MNRVFEIPAREVPVTYEPDVCVIGGGAAGVAAAVAAGRLGLRTLLIEKYGFCGGATVAGLSGTICGLFSSGERTEQIVFGFAGEFYDALKERNGAHDPVQFGKTRLVPHDSFSWKCIADDLLEDAGVKVLYHTDFAGAFSADDGTVTHLTARGKEGMFAIVPGFIVDASGDAEVVHAIGRPTTMGRDGVVQTATMVFRMGGVDMGRFLDLDPREIDALVKDAHEAGEFDLPRHHVYAFPMPGEREVLCNMTRITYPDGSIPTGISTEDISYAERAGRRQALEYSRFLRSRVPGFQDAYLVETGAQVGIRQTRSIVGRRRLTNDDVTSARKDDGAVSISAWPIEAHGAGELRIVYLEDDHYAIPFETLVPVESMNVIVAGRCMSAEHEALASARVTAQCFGMGYAAGAACGLLMAGRRRAADVSGPMIIEYMRSRGLKTVTER